MFIATYTQGSRSFRSEIRQRKIADTGKGGYAPMERGVKKRTASYKHLALKGRRAAMFCCTCKLNPRFLIFHRVSPRLAIFRA
jgi:hypothetical protein